MSSVKTQLVSQSVSWFLSYLFLECSQHSSAWCLVIVRLVSFVSLDLNVDDVYENKRQIMFQFEGTEMKFEVEHSMLRKEVSALRRYNSAWKCGICQKIGSTKRIIVNHLKDVHSIEENF